MLRDQDVRSGEPRRGEVVDRLTGKVGKEDANYRASDQVNSKESCFECEHYLSPGQESSSCRRIAGVVHAEDVCDLFAARPTEFTEQEEKE